MKGIDTDQTNQHGRRTRIARHLLRLRLSHRIVDRSKSTNPLLSPYNFEFDFKVALAISRACLLFFIDRKFLIFLVGNPLGFRSIKRRSLASK
jgi:hypothetical protein